jgi:hypothetical protein
MQHHFPGGRGNHVMVFDGYLDENACDEGVELFKIHYPLLFTPGPTLSGVSSSIKLSQDASLDSMTLQEVGLGGSALESLRIKAEAAMHVAIQRYIEEYESLWYWPGVSESGFRVQHYHRGNGFYRRHADHVPWEVNQANDDNLARVLASIIYLNTVEVGGGTRLVDQDCTVQAIKGRILLFPATWTHSHMGLTPLSSDKFILSSFIHCRKNISNEKYERETWITPLKEDVALDEATGLLKEELVKEELDPKSEEVTEDQ